ncbi:MAG: PcfJ domain-containing protein [Candidatus Latescibacterota bacterium]
MPRATHRPTLSREAALATLAAAKHQMQRPRQALEHLCAGALPAEQAQTVLLRTLHGCCAELDPGGRAALRDLVLHVEGCAALLSTAWGTPRLGRRPGNTLVEGLAALAWHHLEWLRPVGSWCPASRDPHAQFASLARHLLARYPVPAFMDGVWFRGGDAEARRQQGWFRHIGIGQNIRTADLPLRLTRAMAHHLLQAPGECTVEEALRWGQVRGQGGTPALALALGATRLGRSFADEDFWSTVVHFLARHPHLDANLVGPVVEYLHYQRFVPQETMGADGRLESGPPAEPHLSMKSRSLPKLLRQVARWRACWTRDPPLATDTRPAGRKARYEAISGGQRPAAASPGRRAPGATPAYFYREEVDAASGRTLQWSIQQLSTARSLANEGEAMSHCVASYASKLGEVSLWSVQVREAGRTRRVMTVSVDLERRVVTQARGRHNANPEREIDAGDGPEEEGRARGWLSARDRDYLRRAWGILQEWLAQEGITYGPG